MHDEAPLLKFDANPKPLTHCVQIEPQDMARWFALLNNESKAAWLNMAGAICKRRLNCDRMDGVYIAAELDDAGRDLVKTIADGIGKQSKW